MWEILIMHEYIVYLNEINAIPPPLLSHTQTVPSKLAEAMNWPSGDQSIDLMVLLWPSSRIVLHDQLEDSLSMFSESQAHILMYYKAEEEGIKKKRKKNETVK